MIPAGEGARGVVRAPFPRGPRQAPRGLTGRWGAGSSFARAASESASPDAQKQGACRAPAEAVTRSQLLRLPARYRRVPEEQRFPCPEGCGWGTRGSREG